MHKQNVSTRDTNHKNRVRSNWLKNHESRLIAWLCERVPQFINSDMLTGLGLLGSIAVGGAFVLAQWNRYWLLMVIGGLALNWLGDSLDGRLAYYRNRARKWYGFALDISADWLSLTIITIGMAFYFTELRFVPFVFMAAYGARMLIAALSYKLTNHYRIDSGLVGPTEARLLMVVAVLLEIAVPGSILWLTTFATVGMLSINVLENYKLLMEADALDRAEKVRLQTYP